MSISNSFHSLTKEIFNTLEQKKSGRKIASYFLSHSFVYLRYCQRLLCLCLDVSIVFFSRTCTWISLLFLLVLFCVFKLCPFVYRVSKWIIWKKQRWTNKTTLIRKSNNGSRRRSFLFSCFFNNIINHLNRSNEEESILRKIFS